MPIVFVHGVNNRQGPGYVARTKVFDAFARAHLGNCTIGGRTLPPGATTFPYWGDLGMKFAFDMESLPRPDMQQLGGSPDAAMQTVLAHLRDALPSIEGNEPLTALANKKLSLAVDALNQLALDSVTTGDEGAVAAFVVATSAYAEANPHPGWLAQVSTDQELINRLTTELQAPGGVQALGGVGTVVNKIKAAALKLKQAAKNAVGKAIDHAGDFASTKLLAASRDALNGTLGRFFGDVFIYLDSRGDKAAPGEIPRRILDAFDSARAAAPNEPFVVVAHSLGGVISMDLLSHFRPDVEVDLFVTVGSQVGHFEEMKLYLASDPAVPPGKAKTPGNIRRWINIFDGVDIFSYSVERIFDRVDVDAHYDTETYTVKAHGAYFEQDRFYRRLRTRVDGLTS